MISYEKAMRSRMENPACLTRKSTKSSGTYPWYVPEPALSPSHLPQIILRKKREVKNA